MDIAFMRKSIALIAKGLIEKEQLLEKEPKRYPYSKAMQHGINMFLVASQWAESDIAFTYNNESDFLSYFITKPIKEWFDTWKRCYVEKLHLKEEPLYSCEGFAYQSSDNMYMASTECHDFLDSQDNDIMNGMDERILYEKLIQLSQNDYCVVRKYIIEHPIITHEQWSDMSSKLADNKAAVEAFRFAYEKIPSDENWEYYRCPKCGWTMKHGKFGDVCYSEYCIEELNLTNDMKLDISADEYYRLKKGIMRYFAAPGKLELEIAKFCEKNKLYYELWPQMDRYDIEIHFSDGEIWEIDAKVYRNPINLRTKIQNDNGFPSGDYTRGYFVIPTEYTKPIRNYTQIINKVLKNQENVKCVNFYKLKQEIKIKEESCIGK